MKWTVAPVEPTPVMIARGFAVEEFESDPAGVYRAMIAARPQPPVVDPVAWYKPTEENCFLWHAELTEDGYTQDEIAQFVPLYPPEPASDELTEATADALNYIECMVKCDPERSVGTRIMNRLRKAMSK